MNKNEIKDRYPKLDTTFSISPFVAQIIRNPEGFEVCGSYKMYGGNPEKYIEEGAICPNCGGTYPTASDIIGYISCMDCSRSYPATLWYVSDPEKAKSIFNQSVSEVISNNDNIERLNELGEQYNKMYWELMVRHAPKEKNMPYFIPYSINFKMFRYYAGKNDLKLHSKIVECIAEDKLTEEVYSAYCRFLRCDPTMMRVDGKKMLVVSATPKHDLLNKLKDNHQELKKYRKLMEDYMIELDFDEEEDDFTLQEDED